MDADDERALNEKIATVNALIERINTVIDKHWRAGKTCIFGPRVYLERARRWWYIKGIDETKRRGGYVWGKIDPETFDVFSQAGKVPVSNVLNLEDGNIFLSAYGILHCH